MKTTLKILSWVGIVTGGLAIIASMSENSGDVFASFIGGGLFLAQGIVALVYIKRHSLSTREQLDAEKYNEKI